MCGFVAVLNSNGHVEAELLNRMLASIVHRGPDDVGVHLDGAVGFGFRRLSILDLSPAGHQPMSSGDGDLTIVFNGEIYNYVELRKELQALGHSFKSKGDTEVLLAAYRQWGASCLKRLNGMWAFVIHDRGRGLLFGSRDRFGIKPLYLWRNGGQTVLSSEIKAIRQSGLYRGTVDMRAAAAFLHDGQLDTNANTFFTGIVQIPPGHAFEITLDGEFKQWGWWGAISDSAPAPADPPRAFADMFEDAMRLHMRSDVPVGVNLSGGLDSTAIICAAARIREAAGANSPLLAFCYQDRRFDETGFVRDTLAQTGAQLVPLEMSPIQLWDSLSRVLAYQDEPVHSMTALVGFHLMALAARHGVKVILNGQGADEVIGGYGSYFNDRWAELIRNGHPITAWNEIVRYCDSHGGSVRSCFQKAARHVVQSSMRRLPPYRALADARRIERARSEAWLRPELAGQLSVRQSATPLGLEDVLAASVEHEPLPLYLRVEDRNSMAHSIEVRLPFLDHRLVSLVFGMDSGWKLNGPWNKYVLREAMRGRIPESVRSRVDKMGFPTDATAWFRQSLYERLKEVIHDSTFQSSPYFDAQVVAASLEAHKAGDANHSERLFKAVQFHIWLGLQA